MLSTTAKFATRGCGSFSVTWKVTQTPEGQQVLTSAVKALECREREWYAVHNIPYSRNLSRVKTFANFVVLRQFAKVLTAKIFIEYGGIIINGRVIVVSHNSRRF